MNKPSIFIGLILAFSSTFASALDRNSNGMCDIWEARFAVGALDPNGDTDGDALTNYQESIAGTDPFVATSRFRVTDIDFAEQTGARTRIASVPGKSYRLFSAPSPSGPWTAVGSAIVATATELIFPNHNANAATLFYRVSVNDIDSDGDGLSDWAERQIEGLSPNNSDSFNSASPNADLAFAVSWLDSLTNGGFQVTNTVADAYEKENSAAVLTLSRPAPLDRPFTVFLRSAPPSSSTVGVASTNDFQMRTAGGTAITDRFVIPAGQATADILIHPVADTAVEVPEEVRFQVGGSSQFLTCRVCDAEPIEANVKLLVAYLSPRPGVDSLGSGLSTIRIAGDNASAMVTVNFSNLSSLATSAHIENVSGSNIISVPPFRYNGQAWNIKASASYINDQQVLDALLSGNFLFNVYSDMAPSGEIAGFYQSVNGSTDFQIPPAPEPIPSVAGDLLDREIVRFLTQATFGARYQDIVSMRARVNSHGGNRIAAFEAWINEQIAVAAPSHVTMTDAQRLLTKSINPTVGLFGQDWRLHTWWTFAMHSPAQLRLRMAHALSQIFVVSDQLTPLNSTTTGIASYNDMLQENAFGTYRATLEDVTLHPTMGHYLSHIRNEKTTVSGGVTVASPDENYAREIMQLFSIGLVKLHPDGSLILGADGLPIPTYDQEDITEVAKIFTGWSFSKRGTSTGVIDNTLFYAGSAFEESGGRWLYPMKLFPAYHDETEKNFLGTTIPARTGGGLQDLSDILDFLSNHPNTSPFISRQLIQRFTTANPSAGYTHRVATAFTQSGGNFTAVLKAILLDPEARNQSLANTGSGSGKVKEPLLRHTALLRALDAKSAIPITVLQNFGYPVTETAKFPAEARMARFKGTSTDLVQTPVSAPSVFNWYRPDYAPAGPLSENGVVSPEFQIFNETTIIRAINYHHTPIYDIVLIESKNPTANLPTGLSTTVPPGFVYDNNSDNMVADLTQFRDIYLSVLDTNNDGAFSNADTTWADRATLIPRAIKLVVDRADLLLCAGSLKERYGSTNGTPRVIIVNAAASIESQNKDNTSASVQTNSMNERIRDIIYLIAKSPDFIVQK